MEKREPTTSESREFKDISFNMPEEKLELLINNLADHLKEKFRDIQIDDKTIRVTEENNLYLPIIACCRRYFKLLKPQIVEEVNKFLNFKGYKFGWDKIFNQENGVFVKLAGSLDDYPKACPKHEEIL